MTLQELIDWLYDLIFGSKPDGFEELELELEDSEE